MNLLWPAYLKERMGWETISRDEGFVCYSLSAPYCRIEEIYVTPKRHGKGHCSEMLREVEKIAKGAGMIGFWAQVWAHGPTSSDTLAKALSLGFKVIGTEGRAIIMTKEFGG